MSPFRRLNVGVLAVTLTASSCARPHDPDTDRAAAQLAAATRIAADVARNPGPLEVLCIAYSGDWEDTLLPARVGALGFAYAEGCEEIDGQLFAQGGEARALWVGVGEPEDMGASGAVVPVFTSTGVDDLATYRCRVTRSGGEWAAESCEVGAVG
ncbi:MAG: hypothetical protein FJ207_13860 [Gemmatimonadetes bacterium]|nr:hypothetical protein [Gemmatimonadota bacterium]